MRLRIKLVIMHETKLEAFAMLKKVKWNNYKTLKNLELNFCKDDGSSYSTIILAGENGTGKTTILVTLGQFLTGHSMEPFNYMEYNINMNNFFIKPMTIYANSGFHIRKNESKNQVDNIETNYNNNVEKMKNDPDDIRAYGCAYSSAKSKFETRDIKTVTSQQIDATQYSFDDDTDFTSIKQLLIDIDTQDCTSFTKEAQKNQSVTWDKFETESKMYRFKSAFNNFFDNIKYDGIDSSDGAQRIIFKKYNNNIQIDDLSTGEKQIVFRGAYLLRNSGKIEGGIILIDEPELSMHPKWQEKILSFYKNLFIQNNEQKAQLIIATHSEYVIRAALKDEKDTLVIILKDDNGTIKAQSSRTPYILPIVTAAEVNFQAFNIYSIDYHIQLYGYLQSITGKSHIKDMDNYLKPITSTMGLINKAAVIDGKNVTETLPTYIRNTIDHPDNTSRNYTQEELQISTDFLIDCIKKELACKK